MNENVCRCAISGQKGSCVALICRVTNYSYKLIEFSFGLPFVGMIKGSSFSELNVYSLKYIIMKTKRSDVICVTKQKRKFCRVRELLLLVVIFFGGLCGGFGQ